METPLNEAKSQLYNNFVDVIIDTPNLNAYNALKLRQFIVDNIAIRSFNYKNEFEFNTDNEQNYNSSIDQINLKSVFNNFVENNYNEQFSKDLKDRFDHYYSIVQH
jgi:hypothetical protein